MSQVNEIVKPVAILVDDEPEAFELMGELLTEQGYEIYVAKDGEEGLKLLKLHQAKVSIVVTDYQMPGMNGFELRKSTLDAYKGIPFVMVSGFVTREMALQAVDLKISAFLEKPVNPDLFLATVKKESASRIAEIAEERELIVGFLADAEGLVDEIEGNLLNIEEAPSKEESINRIFACAHTIKGASGFFKSTSLHQFTHKYEDYFSQFKKAPATLSPGAVTVLLQGLDVIKTLLGLMRTGSDPDRSIEEMAQIFSTPLDSIPTGDQTTPAVEAKTLNTSNMSGEIDPKKVDDLRVSPHLLDQFMECSGELTVLRNMINKVVRVIEREHPGNKSVNTLSELLEEMHKTNGHMQEKVTDLRKIPLKQVFRPLVRTLRDLMVSLKKKIKMDLVGEELRIDHSLMEVLKNSLIHMVRNSADHGIEDPASRKAIGKNPEGTISIKGEEVDGEVLITLKDDGKGIDASVIKRKAIEKGILTAENAERMSESDIRLLIFAPGFSTAAAVTAVSGRGVGTDMVLKSVTNAGGKIDLRSKVNEGTEFLIRLPIPKSILIISSLLVKSQGESYGLPQEKVERVIRLISPEDIKRINMLEYKNYLEDPMGLIPILHLPSVLDLEKVAQENKIDELILICMNSALGQFALEIDEILDIEDTVVKPLGGAFKEVAVYMGATFLGDGRVGLLLDVDGIAERAGLRADEVVEKESYAKADQVADVKENRESLLLVDLGIPGNFAVKQSDLFRLEEFEKDKLQYSGNQPIVIYRETTMALENLSQILSDHMKMSCSIEAEKEIFQVLVIQSENRFRGFIVRRIVDLVSYIKDESVEIGSEIYHQSIVENKVVNILDLSKCVGSIETHLEEQGEAVRAETPMARAA